MFTKYNSKWRDITNKTFGKLTAISFVEKIKQDERWLFRCECGNEKIIRKKSVVHQQTKSCGCEVFENIKGKRFGRLTAIRKVESKNLSTIWLFKCECGNEKQINKASVIKGDTVSCGCYIKDKNAETASKNIAGQRFGHLIALEITKKSSKGNLWRCVCDCGVVCETQASNLILQRVKSCGCRKNLKKHDHPFWKGGKVKREGYVSLHCPEHPFASPKGYFLEHRLVIEKAIGRYLLRNENVHHKNGIRNDNRLENLELWVKPQPPGQRAEDLVTFSIEILKQYAPELLSAQI